ncbi:glycoside hydrolase family 9 protein [Devosia sp. A369]
MSLHRVYRRLCLLIVLLGCAVPVRAEPVRVVEVSMAAPDIVHVTLRDPAYSSGQIIALPQPRREPNGSWVQHEGNWGLVIGPKRDHLRLEDTPPTVFFDRATADDAAQFGAIGGREVIAVYRKSMPYASGLFRSGNGDARAGASFQHDLYLMLEAPLAPGRHVIEWPNAMLDGTAFVFDDRATRASSLHATQNGHRATDLAKSAYLSLWLPGAGKGGAVDFRRYGIKDFEVLDTAGDVVFTGPIMLRAGPDAPEPGNGLPQALVDYTDSAATPTALIGLTDDHFTTARPHYFAVGQRIGLERLAGEQDAGAVFATIATTTPTGFTISGMDGALPQRLAAGARATPALRANRAGTFVFELDYSAWLPAEPGLYHLRVPGIGVSDPISIADDVWEHAALNGLAGLYHHRSGVPLDGRFGYERPAAFRPGPDFTIVQSRLPLAWSSEFEGFVPFAEATKPDWITSIAAPADFWGGYMDAGDWDRRIQHVEVSWLLLQAHEFTPPERWLTTTGLPKSAEWLDKALYQDSDGLPDLVHEAIWVLDFFRRLQAPDGSIHGGIESAEHPLRGEPSFLEHQTVFAYAPDHLSSYKYAAVAANLARTLQDLDAEALAKLYADSAISAWQAAERGFADPDEFYADAIAAGQASGVFAQVSWPQRRDALQARSGEYRAAAAAALFRLSGADEYGAIFAARWQAGMDLYAHKGDAAWDYLQSGEALPEIAAAIRERFLSEAQVVVETQAHFAYPSLKHPGAPAGWGQGGAPAYSELQLLLRAHQIGGDPAILRALEQAHHVMVGANQLGLSLVTGLGTRAIGNPLHEDRIAMGVAPPAGITIYGWASQAQTAHGWIFGPPWSPLPEVGTAEHAAERRIEPARFSLPYFEYLVEHPALVMQQEYTVAQSIGTMTALALYINAR